MPQIENKDIINVLKERLKLVERYRNKEVSNADFDRLMKQYDDRKNDLMQQFLNKKVETKPKKVGQLNLGEF